MSEATPSQLPPICPHHGTEMAFMPGAGWDYDRYICAQRTGRFGVCDYEIELDTSTYPDEPTQEEKGP